MEDYDFQDKKELMKIAEHMTADEFLLIERWRISAAIPVGDSLVVLNMWHDEKEDVYFTEAYNELDQKTYLNIVDLKGTEVDLDYIEAKYPNYEGYYFSCYQSSEDRIEDLDWIKSAGWEYMHPKLRRLMAMLDLALGEKAECSE